MGTDNNLIVQIHVSYLFGQKLWSVPCLRRGINCDVGQYRRKRLFRFDLSSLVGEYTRINSVTLKMYPKHEVASAGPVGATAGG